MQLSQKVLAVLVGLSVFLLGYLIFLILFDFIISTPK
jgi:hypothetical protein